MKTLLIIAYLLIVNFAHSQCACVWKDINGNIQCYLYSNCSNPNLIDCANKITNGTMCPCTIYPGMNWNCGGCLSNGACWYNGTACDADKVCGYIALPIELIYFKAELTEDGSNIIEWSTASENNSSYFTLENSIDGVTFTNLINISGAGNSTETIKYNIVHEDPRMVVNYYRLSQYDFDGEYKVYDIVVVNNIIKEKEIIGIFNVLGQEVDIDYEGLKIFKYSNGDSFKKF